MIRHTHILQALALLTIVALVAFGATFLVETPPQYIQGQVEGTRISVSAKVPGRVEEMLADEGQWVAKGSVVAVLDSPQLQAKRQQAQGAQKAASAQRDKAEHGAREEQIRMAYSQWQQAKPGADLADKSLGRVQRLHNDGVLPTQRLDEVQAQRDMARKLEAAAKAQYDMAMNGAREEDKAAASALVDQAAGAVSEVDSLLEEATVRAPLDGEILERIVNPGELAGSGMPIVTMMDVRDLWVTFNVREDLLAGLKVGDRLSGAVPALNGQTIELEVSYIAPLGDFAAWRATSASGGFDLRTFEVRGKPKQPIEGLRAGMSVIVPSQPNAPRHDG